MVEIGEIPDELVRAQIGFNGAEGRAFIDGLPARAAAFLERWRLRRTGPVMHGMTALVLPVERADGSAAVLKLVAVDEESAGEPVALRAWGGGGSVLLLEHDAETGTLLLERLDAGRDLAGLARRDARAAVAVIGELLARLTPVAAPAGLRGLGEVAAGLLAGVPKALARLADERDRRLLRYCAAAVAEVAGEPGDRLLHWDLHYGNVLAGGREPWLAIDPKPLAGDPGFELLPAMVNNFRVEDVLWRFDLLTEAAALDRGRARAWTLGRVLQNCLWDVESGERRLDGSQLAVAELLIKG
ncbi:aminoglycoside phosphotransferase family protein [Streptomyces sp. NPDC047014]|uniref:aminoglycoside phosphotransferase family protein n=1 Tax=Streptomyces sp. NPDC047014 TaxID=3155736 RepID=UPI0033DE786F